MALSAFRLELQAMSVFLQNSDIQWSEPCQQQWPIQRDINMTASEILIWTTYSLNPLRCLVVRINQPL
jgi:hypothetical protein